MKFHALALCLAGALVSTAAYADHNSQKSADKCPPGCDLSCTGEMGNLASNMVYRTVTEDGVVREILYPGLPTLSEVATKVSQIDQDNLKEAAELRALEGRARTAGFDNIAAVYDVMAQDHDRGAQTATTWLTSYDFDTPATPSISLAADETPEASIGKLIDDHIRVFNDSLNKMHDERSETVRGMYLMNAATANRHITLLEALNNDVSLGRKTLTARMNWMLHPETFASNSNVFEQITEEDRLLYREDNTEATVAETPPSNTVTVVEVPVETPAPTTTAAAPAPAPTTTATAPIPAPTVVERNVYVNKPQSKVAGKRQTRRGTRGRRPAY